MQEIGGFFGYPEFDCKKPEDSVYRYLTDAPQNYVFIRDGRQAIKVVLQNIPDLEDRVCYLPGYLCHSILQPFKELGLNVEFYGLEHPLKEVKNALIFIINFFGAEVANEEIIELLGRENIVISDITHSIFSKTRFGIRDKNYYLIASLRKVFPIPDGGIVYHTNPNFKPILSPPVDYGTMIAAMELKAQDKDKDYYTTLYRQYEEDKNLTVVREQNIPDISIQILNNLRISNIIKKRNANLDFLYKNIREKEHFLFLRKEIKSTFFLPLMFDSREERDKAKEKLIEENIYPPIHWELPEEIPNFEYAKDISSRILSIPCDQRYGKEDMQRITKILNEVF